jgi:hypothetical protein
MRPHARLVLVGPLGGAAGARPDTGRGLGTVADGPAVVARAAGLFVAGRHSARIVRFWGGGTGTRSFCPHFGQWTFAPGVGCEQTVWHFGQLKLTTKGLLSITTR